ncbi:hypothetical protein Goarm_021469 [Gossypium armourianum]|uniref:RNase H type-1 domain-containing protein n=1 Tax=Gossypium armourianum TaxID=34283 RepID=A0A7J9IRV7_9ROSI|nr:hypothetical protein [Gossypium armourianum]
MRTLTKAKEAVEWKQPMRTIIKINFDGTYDRQRNRSASCIVARDAEREVLVSKSENHKGVPSAFATEAIASHRAMRFGIRERVVGGRSRGDELTIIQKCQSQYQDKSHIGAYIQNFHQLKGCFQATTFKHVPRSTNGLAHTFAIESLKRSEEFYLVGSVSSFARSHFAAKKTREPN